MSKYKVFLADDEIVVREGIRSTFPWEESDFVLAGEAPDGEIALNMMQDIKPDILITDIRMPFMDGLALCRMVRRTMPWIYIIIISGYDDFSYAKEAISIGVEEYLLKPVSGQDLLQVLNRIALRIREDKQKQDYFQAFKEQVASSSSYLKQKLLQEIISGKAGEDIHMKARPLQINLMASKYLIILLKPFVIQHTQEETLKPLAIGRALDRLAESSGGSSYFCELDTYFAFLVLGDTEVDLDERAYGLAQAAQYEVERLTCLKLQIAIGKPANSLLEIDLSFKDAQKVLKEMDKQHVAHIMSMEDVSNSENPGDNTDFFAMDLEVTPLHEQLKYANIQDVDKILSYYVKSMGDTAVQSTVFADYIYIDILRAASKIIKDSGGDPANIIPEAFVLPKDTLYSLKLSDIYPLLEKILVQAVAFKNRDASNHYGPIIKKATAFLKENFADASLTLKDVASHVSLSNNHFCTVFSQETGVTYTQYLTDLRLDKAKEFLITTALRSSDICYAVGYNDPHYFSYLFKKNIGLSPREFRKTNQKDIGDTVL